MADVYEQNLPQKADLTTSDYVRVVGSDNNSYKQPLSDVAQKTVENYAGSTLAGSAQSVKSAIDGLNTSINGVVSDLTSESSTRASQDTNLQTQINQIVAPTGTAPNPAEIENARIGADNVTYTTLGDAIRTQVTDLKSAIDAYQSEVKLAGNLITELIAGKYPSYNSSGVVIGTDSNRAYTKIKVKPNHTYSISDYISGNFSFWAYEENGTDYGISKINSFTTNFVVTAPSNATWMYISNSGWDANTDIVVMETDISIFGAHRSDYPFGEVVQIDVEKLADLNNIIDVVGIEKYSKWERGDLDYSDSSAVPTKSTNWTYTDQRICTPISEPITLSAGDVLSINGASNVTFVPSYYNGTAWHTDTWRTADFVAPVDGDYWVCIRHTNNATLSSMNELSDVFTITRINGIVSNTWKVPQYYFENDYLPSKVSSIKSKNEILNGVNFVFVTDLHFAVNEGKSKHLINYIRKNTSVDMVICGGDFARAYGSMVQLGSDYDDTIEFMNTVGKDCFYGIRGNHDFHDKLTASSDYSNMYTWAKTYNAIYRNSELRVTNALVQHGAYCIDNDAQKTRFICLNSSDWNLTYDKKEEGVPYISVDQARWFIAQLEEKSGWNIIVVSHIPSAQSLSSNYDSQAIIQDILESFKSRTNFSTTYKSVSLSGNFSTTTNTLICHISGHEHTDGNSVDSGVLSIVTTCDALYQDDGYGGIAGTVTEQAFDVFSINYDTGKINATRVGRGNDREWTY